MSVIFLIMAYGNRRTNTNDLMKLERNTYVQP